jgi:hypothetical protein
MASISRRIRRTKTTKRTERAALGLGELSRGEVAWRAAQFIERRRACNKRKKGKGKPC